MPARKGTATVPAALLQIDNARKQFGGVIAVTTFVRRQAREIVALIGPNGAGKSTTFNPDHRRAHFIRRHDLRARQKH